MGVDKSGIPQVASMKQILSGLMAGFIAFAGTVRANDMETSAPAWHIQSAADAANRDASGADALAVNLKEQIIVWDGPGSPEAASEIHLLVDAPYADVQPAVQKALANLGQFDSDVQTIKIAYQPNGWDKVLLSRRPDLRDALATHLAQPALELSLREGTLTPAEVDQRMALARADTSWPPQGGAALDAFQKTYASYHATQNRSYGVLNGSKSELCIYVIDVSASFGHPATTVRISRLDTYPNPNYSKLKALRDFNPFGPHAPRTSSSFVVPATVFDAVRTALAAVSSGQEVRIARAPTVWALESTDDRPATHPSAGCL
jgi:hypothetical protein